MKTYMTAGAALLLTTSIAMAGGLDRSGQSIGAIFEDGDYAELSFGSVMPSLSGSVGGGAVASGNIGPSYVQLGVAYKTQVNDQVSLAVIYDQPFGADVLYPTGTGYPIAGYNAQVGTDSVTALGRYEFNSNFSVHGGLRYVQARGVYDILAYNSTYSTDGGFGYVVGGAYEREEIALRVALTYSSEIDLNLDGSGAGGAGDLSTTLPESINLDFQTGVAEDTLVFGSIRYVAWDGFALVDAVNPTSTGSILSYDDDVITYNIGVGRRITDNFAASFGIGYEASTGETTGQLGPTDGYISYQIGGAYTMDNGVEVSGGVRYVDLGDATTDAPLGAAFNDNHAIAVGLKVAMSF